MNLPAFPTRRVPLRRARNLPDGACQRPRLVTRAGSSVAPFLVALSLIAGCDSGIDDGNQVELRPLTATEQAVVTGDRIFGLSLFEALNRASPDSNVAVSPLSVSMALGMAANGAAGNTRNQMWDVLGKSGLTDEEVNATYAYLLDALPYADNDVDVFIANSVWTRQGFPIRDSFLTRVKDAFDAEIAELDFGDPGAPNEINGWVSDATRGLIPSIIETIPPKAVAYLINAVYFKGAWQTPFDPDNTLNSTFRNLDGTEVLVPMMRRTATVAHHDADTFEAFELSYGDSLYSMMVLLPDASTNINTVLAKFDSDAYTSTVASLTRREFDLALPRFAVQDNVKLNDVLISLGAQDAFSEQAADFSRMTDAAQLFLTAVLHKVTVTVTEEGTEAAAATAVEVGVTSVPQPLHVDRPFAFLIRERTTGTILFCGKVAAL